MTVLVLTGSEDPMWPFVWEAATPKERENLVLFTTDRPQECQLSYSPTDGEVLVRIGSRTLRGNDIEGVWWRRIVPPALTGGNEEIARYAQREYVAFFESLEYALPLARWVSRPSAIVRAGHKALQLDVAKGLGFDVLPTLLTNSPDMLRRFAAEAPTIYKSIFSPRVTQGDAPSRSVFTTLLHEEHIAHADEILSCPGLLQRYCNKVCDVRVTVFAGRAFAVRIYSQELECARTDFRIGGSRLRYEAIAIPREMEQRCIELVRCLGLGFGAIDYAETGDGAVFFEVNANGQWGWLEEKTSAPMRRALLDELFGR